MIKEILEKKLNVEIPDNFDISNTIEEIVEWAISGGFFELLVWENNKPTSITEGELLIEKIKAHNMGQMFLNFKEEEK